MQYLNEVKAVDAPLYATHEDPFSHVQKTQELRTGDNKNHAKKRYVIF
uniref:Uncharacterized protein n=1 Tax=Aliivibrio wodanis TaxID=80852 RepID=A0A5Q4ZX45_9GAMM|nr:hypothetical protein AW0309160_01504 [Aliivibrio wodanis]VVV04131.1 hypothetical protein AW0309160_01514 [Aliivibrio wodanis]VVV04141.1 hypothetical protein AW0309160_01524 [Aliivibrio wodanis]